MAVTETYTYEAWELGPIRFKRLQDLARQSWASALGAEHDGLAEELVLWDDPDTYFEAHLHPESEAAKMYFPDFSESKVTNPRVVVQSEEGDPTGFLYAVDRAKGGNLMRQINHLSILNRELVLAEAAVLPDHQSLGIGVNLTRKMLATAVKLQPVAAYVPEHSGDLDSELEEYYGFHEVGEYTYQNRQEGPVIEGSILRANSVRAVLNAIDTYHN